MAIVGVKGTHDVFGVEADQFSYVESTMANIAELFNYKEIRLPVIEHSELFVRGVGESSDVVRKEMYTFLDKGDRSITLRPEFTAGIVRSFVQNKGYVEAEFPVKFYYCGPVFRYERPQLGRYRQFNQFGVEALGSNSPYVDVDVITLAYSILSSLDLEGVTLNINSLGDEESRNSYRDALKEYFSKYIDNMCEDCKSRFELNPLRILDCKDPSDKEIIANAPSIKDYLSDASKARFDLIIKQLDLLQIPYEIDYSLVRGLDYYSEVVFEFHYKSKKGVDYGAVGAGGHYSSLVKEIGGPDMPGVGFSFGIERVVSILKDDGLLTDEDPGIFAYVIPLSESESSVAQGLLTSLRLAGYKSEMCYELAKVSSMFKKASKKNAKYAVVIGADEVKNKVVQVKDLANATQETIPVMDLIKYFDAQHEDDECHCGCHCDCDDDCDCGCDCHCDCDDNCDCGCHDGHECHCGCHEDSHCGCGCDKHDGHGCSCGCDCHCGYECCAFICLKEGKCPCGKEECECRVNKKCKCMEGK